MRYLRRSGRCHAGGGFKQQDVPTFPFGLARREYCCLAVCFDFWPRPRLTQLRPLRSVANPAGVLGPHKRFYIYPSCDRTAKVLSVMCLTGAPKGSQRERKKLVVHGIHRLAVDSGLGVMTVSILLRARCRRSQPKSNGDREVVGGDRTLGADRSPRER